MIEPPPLCYPCSILVPVLLGHSRETPRSLAKPGSSTRDQAPLWANYDDLFLDMSALKVTLLLHSCI